jgi:HlyD family secretion protein
LLWTIVIVAALAIGATYFFLHHAPVDTPAATAAAPPVTAVACTGSIEPWEPPTRVGAPQVNGHPPLLAELKVAEGDTVRAGQVIAILEGRAQLEASLRQSEARVAQAAARVEQVKAGPKPSDVAAQRAEIARWEAALNARTAEYERYVALSRTHDVSASDVDAKKADVEDSRHLLAEANARLKGLSEIRQEDVRAAESEQAVARAEVERLQVELATTIVHSPVAGIVLHVRARPGEEVGSDGLIQVAQTATMSVVAEVYETDIGRVKLGQQAVITGELLPQKLVGEVAVIGSEIGRAENISTDPAAFADSRVVRVRIRLADGAPVAGLIHGKVKVVIGQ